VISIKHYVTGKHWSAELGMFKQQKEIFTQFKNKTFYWDTENFQLTAWIISTSSGSGSGLISNVSSSKLIACLASSSCTQTKRQYNKVISCLALPRSKAKITFDVTIAVLPMKGRVEEMNNFTYPVLAAVALFRLCVFRSVSVRFIVCFVQRKVSVNLSKSKLIVVFSYNPCAFEKRFGSINSLIKLTRVFVKSYDVHLWVEEHGNCTYMARQQR